MKTRIIKINPQDPDLSHLKQAADIIKQGGVIGYPTETVYGLGASIFNQNAVDRIYAIKGRTFHKPLIVIVDSYEMLQPLVQGIPEIGHTIMQKFWPGPLTLIFKASSIVNKKVLGGGSTIAIRIPDNKICLTLLKLSSIPLTSTSANVAGEPASLSAEDVERNLHSKLELIIDGGPSRSSEPSTVLDLTTERPLIRRIGIIPVRLIEGVKLVE